MASASARKSEYECPVCQESFSTAKILPCAHLLCRHCLLTRLEKDNDAKCPVCNDVIFDVKDRKDKSYEDTIDALPTDLAMEARVECAGILSERSVCDGCETTVAISICLDCGDMLCSLCTKAHRNLSVSCHHKVERLAELSAERLAASRQISCSHHEDEVAQFYCPTHEEASCQLCVTATHGACPEVIDLEERVEEARGMLGELAAILKSGEFKLERVMGELDCYLQDVEKATQKKLSEIDRIQERLRSALDQCCHQLRERAKGPHSEAKHKVEKEKAGLSKRRSKVASHWRLVNRIADEMPRVCAVSDLPETLDHSVHSLDLDLTLPAEFKVMASPKLPIDEKSVEHIEQELLRLGQWVGKTEATSAKTGQLASVNGQGLGTTWEFHTKHGENIQLSEDCQSALRVRGDEDAIVVSRDAMTPNALYEVEVEALEGNKQGWVLRSGVVVKAPDSLVLPVGGTAGWVDAVVIGGAAIWMYGPQIKSDLGKPLGNLRVGSRVGLVVGRCNCLHLYIDGKHRGVVAREVHRPCFFFVSVDWPYKQVRALPLRTVL